MEASTLHPPAATLAQPRAAIGAPLLRFRSDDQLVALFRAGHEEAFRAIHDRYHRRLFAYARQMLPGRQDAEDALQDVFVRAYAGLRASDRGLALRAWLFRVAHNRCVDELRKPAPPPPEVLQLVRSSVHDPLVELDLRESLRRLVEDIRRLPDQQRSALLMRELAGMSYAEVASSLGTSVGAVKSLLVRARITLAQAADARETACTVIREQLVEAHDRGVRPSANTRNHMRDCSECKRFRGELRGVSRQLAAVAPAPGMVGLLMKVIGFSGGGGSAGGGVALLGGGGSAASTGGVALGANHLATLIIAAAATAGGAVEIQHTILPAVSHPAHVRSASRHSIHRSAAVTPAGSTSTVQAAAVNSAVSRAATAPGSAEIDTVSKRSISSPSPARTRTRTAAAAKRRALAGLLSTAAGTSTTSLQTAPSGSCTTTTSTSTSTASSGAATSSSPSSTTPTSSGTTPTSSSSSSTPSSTPTCGSTTASPTQGPTASSESTGSATTTDTGSTGSTSGGSSSPTASSPSTGAGSSPSGSAVTTG